MCLSELVEKLGRIAVCQRNVSNNTGLMKCNKVLKSGLFQIGDERPPKLEERGSNA